MGLGKTIQMIGVLAHLAVSRGIWGPHLIVVPSSIILNWEIEFKRWAPGFKILTYYGSLAARKAKRKGWSRPNHFNVCITSYKLAVVDQVMFRRKRWYYMVLDEAHLIKNSQSLRWQALTRLNTRARLLLTGTPLQNDVAELWALLHFLMPHLFDSSEEFREWFSEPVKQALERNREVSEQIIARLHSVLRPFFLRRLKKDVEKELPSKTEYVVRCQLSSRQRYLYD
jgi:SNF2 family DNA or RNA helicase